MPNLLKTFKNLRLFFISITLGIFFSFNATAKLPFTAFFKVTDCFPNDYKYLSPTLGMAALDSGVISNLRFYGNYQKAYKKNDSGLNERDFINDSSTDPIWNITKILFPSNTGVLGYEITNPISFSQNVSSPHLIALLLAYATDIRTSMPDQWEKKEAVLRETVAEIMAKNLVALENAIDPDPQKRWEKDRLVIQSEKENDLKKQETKVEQFLRLTPENTQHIFNSTKKNQNENERLLNEMLAQEKSSWEAPVQTILSSPRSNEDKINDIFMLFTDLFSNKDTMPAQSHQEAIKKQILEDFIPVSNEWKEIAKTQPHISLQDLMKMKTNEDILILMKNDEIHSKIEKIEKEKIKDKTNTVHHFMKPGSLDEREKIILENKEIDSHLQTLSQEKDKSKAIQHFMKPGSSDEREKIILENEKVDAHIQALNQEKIDALIKLIKKELISNHFIKTKYLKDFEKINKNLILILKDQLTKLAGSLPKQIKQARIKIEKMKAELSKGVFDDDVKAFQTKRAHQNDGFWIDKDNKKSTLTQLLEAIKESILQEKKNTFYPRYFPEQLLLSFFCEKFNAQEDIKTLLTQLHTLNPKIILKDKIKFIRPLKKSDLQYIDSHDFSTVGNTRKGYYDFDDLYNLQNKDRWSTPFPYNPKSVFLLSNGKTYPFDRKNNRILTSTTFADCVEIAIRHFMNLVLFDRKTNNFDLSPLANNNSQNPYFSNLQDFYSQQTPDKSENGTLDMRSQWNKVVGDLNAIQGQDPLITYVQTLEGSGYELETGFINFINVCNKITGLKPITPLKPNASLDEAKEWFITSFADILKVLNSREKFNVKVDNLYKKNNDFYGKITITSRGFFSTTITSTPGHSFVSVQNLNRSQNLSMDKDKIKIASNTSGEILLLLFKETQMFSFLFKEIQKKIKNPLYTLFSLPLDGNEGKIEALTNINESMKNKNIPHDLKNMIINMIEDLTLSDQHILYKAAPILVTLYNRNDLKDSLLPVFQKFSLSDDMLTLEYNKEEKFQSVCNIYSLVNKKIPNVNTKLDIAMFTKFLNIINNTSITDLNLLFYHIRPFDNIDGIISSFLSLAKHSTLTELTLKAELTLKGYDFEEKMMESFIRELSNNKTLRSLNLKNINLNIKSINKNTNSTTALIDMFKTNNTLRQLVFSNCGIDLNDLGSLLSALKTNKNLITLGFNNYNFEGDSWLTILLDGLMDNQNLRILDLTDCYFDKMNLKTLVEFLKKNKHLKTIMLNALTANLTGYSRNLEELKKEFTKLLSDVFSENPNIKIMLEGELLQLPHPELQ